MLADGAPLAQASMSMFAWKIIQGSSPTNLSDQNQLSVWLPIEGSGSWNGLSFIRIRHQAGINHLQVIVFREVEDKMVSHRIDAA